MTTPPPRAETGHLARTAVAAVVTLAGLVAPVSATTEPRTSAVPVVEAETPRDRTRAAVRGAVEPRRPRSLPSALVRAVPAAVPVHAPRPAAADLGAIVVYDIVHASVTVGAPDRAGGASRTRERPGHAGGAWIEVPTTIAEDGPGGSTLAADWRMNKRGKPHKRRWRAHCRIITEWSDERFTQASGVLIDPYHVLTAGHVIHAGDGGRFARRSFVVPAYDGDGGRWGVATSTRLISFEGWTEHGDQRHDVGLIRLDRPVGAITGWHGFATEDRCRFFEDRRWDNAGYPGEDPFNGRFLYSRSGGLRDCSGRQLTLSTGSYGGQSGSAVYLERDDGVTYAVVSSRNPANTRTFAPRLTDDKFRKIARKIDRRRPSRFDLVPLDVRAEDEVRGGERLESFSYLVHNYSDDVFEGRVRVDVLLSTNPAVTEQDRVIQDHTFRARIRPLDSVRITARPRIPRNAAVGTHYLGVVLHKNDDDRSNNIATEDDAHRLTVRPATPAPPPDGARGSLVETLRAWAAGHATADVNGDHLVDVRDLLVILAEWRLD